MELRKVASIIKKWKSVAKSLTIRLKKILSCTRKKTQTILEEAGHTEVLEALEKAKEPVEEDVQVDESPEVAKTEQSLKNLLLVNFQLNVN